MKSADQRPRNDESWLGLQAEGIAPDKAIIHLTNQVYGPTMGVRFD
jgi:hypothetical protein